MSLFLHAGKTLRSHDFSLGSSMFPSAAGVMEVWCPPPVPFFWSFLKDIFCSPATPINICTLVTLSAVPAQHLGPSGVSRFSSLFYELTLWCKDLKRRPATLPIRFVSFSESKLWTWIRWVLFSHKPGGKSDLKPDAPIKPAVKLSSETVDKIQITDLLAKQRVHSWGRVL